MVFTASLLDVQHLKGLFWKVWIILEVNLEVNPKNCQALETWASAAGGKGAVAPLDFHSWYKYRERLKSATFRCFFAIFRCKAEPHAFGDFSQFFNENNTFLGIL